jgi:hypothetical protein
LSLGLLLGVTGCASFLQEQGMKNYRVTIKPVASIVAPNAFQEDFLYLKALAEEAVPLEDHYFPPEKRAAMEQEILQQLGAPNCSQETFVFYISRYLSALNNQHAAKYGDSFPFRFDGHYPVFFHYVGNDLFLANITREYDRSLLGQKIASINGRPVNEVVEKLSAFVFTDNLWTRRAGLEAYPFYYSQPDAYRLAGLSAPCGNKLELEFADHAPVAISAVFQGHPKWYITDDKPCPVTVRSKHLYDCRISPEQNYAYLQFNACFDKSAILDGLDSYLKPWLRPLARIYLSYQFRRKKPTGQFAQMYDPERPLFKDYLAGVIRDMNRQRISNLIIDLRYNAGGELELGRQLLYHLTQREELSNFKMFCYNPEVFACYSSRESRESRLWYLKKFGAEPPTKQLSPTPQQDQAFFSRITDPKSPFYVAPDRPVFKGRVIVLANQDTGSAAAILTGLMQDNQLALIVGTTTANNPTGPTNLTPFKLPRSGLRLSLPSVYLERAAPAKGEVLQPDYWIENTVSDLQTGRDAAFEKALALVRAP